MTLRITGSSRRELLAKLIAYSSIYGLIHVNYIDLVTPGSSIPGYHLWLIALYFAPFVPILFVLGFDDWELLVSMGLTASLMNDLFYYPIGMVLFGREVDLVDWYTFQLGFNGLRVDWSLNLGFTLIPVSSLLMGASIYARIILTVMLLHKWWREE
ncbi:MAG: hypothetical protein QXS32_09040 [Candidatus Nezhaarchaeales archaeon]